MNGLVYGSLFSGYGGLDLAVEQMFDATCAWHSELDPNASKVLTHHWPTVPNHGDITAIDWAAVEPVDILCGGFPCQDISSAGRGAGIKEGTRSGLWYRYADAVRVLRPRLVLVENVSALLVRGLDIVVGSLAEIGYDAQWTCVRASDVGAPHRRDRLFLAAWPAANPHHFGCQGAITAARGNAGRVDPGPDHLTLLPRPVANDSGNTPEEHLRKKPGREVVTSLTILVENGLIETGGRLLPTPSASDGTGSRRYAEGTVSDTGRRPDGSKAQITLSHATRNASTTWGPYEPAVRRWEHLTRPAPSPLDDKGRLNALLPEWMMGLPHGWVTDHLARGPALRAIGNGVLPAQAVAAYWTILAAEPPGAVS